jgi:hypothetical protein
MVSPQVQIEVWYRPRHYQIDRHARRDEGQQKGKQNQAGHVGFIGMALQMGYRRVLFDTLFLCQSGGERNHFARLLVN